MFDQSLLPTVLRHDEIALFDGESVRILDRRKYPLKREYVYIKTPEDAYRAIKEMVTQGGGPLEVSLKTMLLAKKKGYDLEKTAKLLSSSRPTNKSMENTLKELLARVKGGEDIESAVDSILFEYDDAYDKMSTLGSSLIQDGDGILTTCFAEHSFLLSCKKAQMEGKRITIYVPETRPYLQGARLTIPSINEMGLSGYLITDGMPAFFMREKKITKYMTASDAILSDYSIINKVGTLENAICAHYFNIPYYPFSLKSSKREYPEIEMRDGEEVKRIGDFFITEERTKALYPAFDIVDRSLITAIVTKDGLINLK